METDAVEAKDAISDLEIVNMFLARYAPCKLELVAMHRDPRRRTQGNAPRWYAWRDREISYAISPQNAFIRHSKSGSISTRVVYASAGAVASGRLRVWDHDKVVRAERIPADQATPELPWTNLDLAPWISLPNGASVFASVDIIHELQGECDGCAVRRENRAGWKPKRIRQ